LPKKGNCLNLPDKDKKEELSISKPSKKVSLSPIPSPYIWLDFGEPPKYPTPYTAKKIEKQKEKDTSKNKGVTEDDRIRAEATKRTRINAERTRARTRSFYESIESYELSTRRNIELIEIATEKRRDNESTERYLNQLFHFVGNKFKKFQQILDKSSSDLQSGIVRANAEFGRGLIQILKRKKSRLNNFSTPTKKTKRKRRKY